MIYTIKNDVLEIGVNSLGAELTYIKKNNINRLYDKSSGWKKQSPILFPMIGTTKDNFYYYNKQKYLMNPHGFAFTKEFKMIKCDDTSISLLLSEDEDSLKIYPFKFNLTITYKLNNNCLEVLWNVFNTDNKQLLFNIGGHPGFSFNCDNNLSYKDYKVTFDEEIDYSVYSLSGSNIDTLVNYNKKIKTIDMSELIFKHNTAIFKDVNNATLHSKNFSIRIDSNTKYLAFWHPENPTFMCIEPWDGLPDMYNTNNNLEDKYSIIKLEKNCEYKTSYKITID